MKIRSLAETEAQWTSYLEADEGSPEAFFCQVLTLFAAWVADQELASIKRRTREGLERLVTRARSSGRRGSSTQGRWRRCDGCETGAPASRGSPATSSALPAPSYGCCSGRERHRKRSRFPVGGHVPNGLAGLPAHVTVP